MSHRILSILGEESQSEGYGLDITVSTEVDAEEINEMREYEDGTLFADESLSSLIDDLYHNGLTKDEIERRHDALYGNCIDFYYHDDMFYMHVLTR